MRIALGPFMGKTPGILTKLKLVLAGVVTRCAITEEIRHSAMPTHVAPEEHQPTIWRMAYPVY